MASAIASSCLSLPIRLKSLSLSSNAFSCSPSSSGLASLSFSSSLSRNVFNFNRGCLSLGIVQRPNRFSVVCEAAPKRKADSVEKRARQSEKRRLLNRARKSEIRTRMKKVLVALDKLKKKREAEAEEVLPIEKLIAEAYSAIDRAVKVGTVHRNTGARRKSRLARRKKAVEIHHGWYTPAPPAAAAVDAS